MTVIGVMLMFLIQLSLLAPTKGSCENCATCQGSNTCILCNDGYYLSNGICTLCKDNCKHCFNETACDQCFVGFYLDAETGSCPACRPVCKSCDSNEVCRICEDKYYFDDGECITCPITCSTCLSPTYCTSCYQGYWGSLNCSYFCPGGCKGSICDKNGLCVECPDGKYGRECQYPCHENCINNKCSITGDSCPDGCIPGFHGPVCNLKFPFSCSTNVCSGNGKCTAGCKPGLYGNYCHQTCQLNTCLYNECFQNNGSCISTCPETCEACTSFTSCTSCKQGHYGTICEYRCPDSNCKCYQETGECLKCKDRWWGIKCDQKCSDTCKSCLRNGTCVACIAGYYNGESCDFECSTNCLKINGGLVCDMNTGQCDGCKPGFFGTHCNNECSDGCGEDDDGKRSCRQDDGGCEFGCEIGFYGRTCAQTTVNAPPEESTSNTQLIGAIVGGIGAVLIVAAAIVVYLQRRQNPGCLGNMKEGPDGRQEEGTVREAETNVEYVDLQERSDSDGFYNQLGFNDTSRSPYAALGDQSRDNRTYSELQTETRNDHVVTTPAEYENMSNPSGYGNDRSPGIQYENVTDVTDNRAARLNGTNYENAVV